MQMQTFVVVCMCYSWPLGCTKGKKGREYLFWAVTVLLSYSEFVVNYRRISPLKKKKLRKYSS